MNNKHIMQYKYYVKKNKKMASSNIAQHIIDEECKYKNSKVYVDENNCVYACTLNQTNVKQNANKFYIMQLLCLDQSRYCHFIRYGRIGESGKAIYKEFDNVHSAVYSFEKQFKSKTGNKWENIDNFVLKKGKYFLTEISYDDVSKNDLDKLEKAKELVESKLDERVQNLIKIVSDLNMMKNALIQLDIDPKKMPLGKISVKQIEKARELLNIATDIVNKNGCPIDENEICEITSEFYTLIPYSCGRNVPPIIDTMDIIGKNMEMLDDLKNIQVGTTIIENTESNKDNPIDSVYSSLNATITPLDKQSNIYTEIEKYVYNTHAKTHNHYTTELLDVFQVERNGSREIYEKYTKGIDNRYLLFHGSRLSNIMGITKLGLLLNPEKVNPNVHISGKMFSYGIYTANSFSKSFNYCGFTRENPIACLFLCEVALGKIGKRQRADYYINKQSLKKEGVDSIWGQGKVGPDMDKCTVLPNGTKIPNNKLGKTNVNGSLRYDEFIVYDQRQLDIKYILLVKANMI